ncbi:DUF389 domain-containing protein [Rubritalea tangerina]|uniref:DUF389 domain-containing protein n=1 Tax=Rubritalea tangerina TaxID=430798 RepID=A0ABW4Z8F3_9BACT
MNILLVVRDEETSSALVQWSLRLTAARASKLWVLRVREGSKVGEVVWGEALEYAWWQGIEALVAGQEDVEVVLGEVETVNVTRSVKRQLAETKAGLLVVQDRVSHPEYYRNAIESLMDTVACAVMILRIGEGDSGKGDVLLPCAGGPNSRRGLKLAADAFGQQTTAFFVQPDTDEVAAEVGEQRLGKFLKRSGVGSDSVTEKVVLGDSVYDAIRAEVESGQYGMLLIGASGIGSVRRKLFGTVPDKLLRGAEGMSVGVVRAEKPIGHRLRNGVERLLQLTVPQLRRDERVALFADIEDKSRWSFDFGSLMILATGIAALGLLADSGAVVIGAMLVAPLMTPLLGGGLAVVQGNWPLWRRCQKAVGFGFVAALVIGYSFGWIGRLMGYGLTDELIARGAPSVLDLGVAFISGVAASYCLARPKLSGALAGVAIAAALVPPIATTGICMALEKWKIAQGAAVLFGTNVVAIVLGSSMNFFMAGIRGKADQSSAWAKRVTILFTLLLLGLMVPLSSVVVKQLAGGDDITEVFDAVVAQDGLEVHSVKRMPFKDGVQVIEITINSSRPIEKELMQLLQSAANDASARPVKVRVVTRLVVE